MQTAFVKGLKVGLDATKFRRMIGSWWAFYFLNSSKGAEIAMQVVVTGAAANQNLRSSRSCLTGRGPSPSEPCLGGRGRRTAPGRGGCPNCSAACRCGSGALESGLRAPTDCSWEGTAAP